ncbi:flavodoxin domain-containing protein [Streptomyces sp. BH097]|uniref:flavodoxin domain-containing protein n=1 Tax=unclassified Streptomyces TaxID=2593676 RepID=UPI003BB68311
MTALVAYASAHGSTRTVAECIAARLSGRGLEVVVAPLGPDPELAPYRGVVLGSAVHSGAWLPEAAAYVRRRHEALTARQVWLFSVGMAAALPGPLRRLAARREPGPIAGVVRLLHPRGYRRFSGVIRREHLDRRGRLLFRLLGCRYGDYRDWAQVDAWADGIAEALSG